MATKKAPSAAVRKKYGGGKGIKSGSFPVDTVAHAKSAVRLRGHNAGGKKAVLDKVARSAAGKNPAVKKAVAAARKTDRRRK